MAGIKRANKLNDLSGTEWIKFTKSWSVYDLEGTKVTDYNREDSRKIGLRSWFIHNPPPREPNKILHPASFPETMIKEFILFFTKKGGWVLDPFLGSGTTLISAFETGRNAIGIELSEYWANIAKKRLEEVKAQKKLEDYAGEEETKQIIVIGDSREIDKIWAENDFPLMDFVITSPPYWNQLKRTWLRQKKRRELGLPTEYSEDEKDIGNIDDYEKFIIEEKLIFDKIYNICKDNSYLVIITNNIFANKKLYPLAFDTLLALSEKWCPKDEKLWLQDDKALLPLGIYNEWIGNRHHQYCLIFKKESSREKELRNDFEKRVISLYLKLLGERRNELKS
ncbi:MAG: DNA methyltransferase [Nitrososphaerota archaeon]|nr:site-specific DNA-methyltransferase [Candidatus Aenigmarchaeota archaeon]MDW8034734.1 DNA methyltransferase [Nitrososphaerota archaeon]